MWWMLLFLSPFLLMAFVGVSVVLKVDYQRMIIDYRIKKAKREYQKAKKKIADGFDKQHLLLRVYDVPWTALKFDLLWAGKEFGFLISIFQNSKISYIF